MSDQRHKTHNQWDDRDCCKRSAPGRQNPTQSKSIPLIRPKHSRTEKIDHEHMVPEVKKRG